MATGLSLICRRTKTLNRQTLMTPNDHNFHTLTRSLSLEIYIFISILISYGIKCDAVTLDSDSF